MRRYLIARLSAMGDVVTSLPAATSMRAAFPDCRIQWIVDPKFAGLVECCSAVDEIVPWAPSWRWPRFDEKFDAVLDLQGLFKSAWATIGASATTRVGYHRQREGSWLFSARVLPDPTSFHIADQMVDVARALGGAETADFGLKPNEDDVAKFDSILPEKFVAINPGGGRASKMWPASKFCEVLARLPSGTSAVVLGSPGEAGLAAEVCKGNRAVNLTGQTSVRELVAVLSRASAYLGGDTGTTHLAGALGIPAIGLYGVTQPTRFCAYGQIERTIYDPAGVPAIPIEAVYTKLMEALV